MITNVRPNELPPTPTLKLTLDRAQAQSMGLTTTDVYQTIQLMLAPVYVNDFYYEGRVLRATMQADAPFRMNENSLRHFYLPAGTSSTTNSFAMSGDDSSDNMVPLSSVLQTAVGRRSAEPRALQRLCRHQHQRHREAGAQLGRGHG